MEINAIQQTIKELTMLLLYLTRFTEYDKFLDKEYSWTWKGYNFDVINQLNEENYINQGTHPSRTKK